MLPKVSVIVPVYGVEQYIEKCTRSLFEQTLEDIEFIFVDDCTQDNSIEILLHILEDYPHRQQQTRIIHHEINKGLPLARKTGIENATGEYIAHCDSDDWVDKEMYSIMYNKAKTDNCDVVVCDLFKTEYQTTNAISYFPQKKFNKDSIFKHILSNTCSHYIWALLCKKNVYQCGIQFPVANWFEDLVFSSQILYKAHKIGYIQKPLYHYIIRPTSMTNVQTLDKKRENLPQMKKNTDVILSFIEENKIGKKYEDILKIFQIINYKEIIRTKQQEKEYKQYNYSSIKGPILFNKDLDIILKIRYILVKLKLYRLYDWLEKKSNTNPWFKNKLS